MVQTKLSDITYPLDVERYEAELLDDQYTDGTLQSVVGYTSAKTKVDPARVDEHVLPEAGVEDPMCYAKIANIRNLSGKIYQKFFIKAGGRQGGLYNPWGVYTEGTEHLEAKTKGKSMWSFISVDRSIFIKYCRFLKTRNLAWLHNAEREQKNG